jgi:hypothetical protein
MADHTIVLTLTNGIHAVPSPNTTIARVGDTIRYDTTPPDLQFRVEFPGSPFRDVPARVIEDREPRELVAEGRFFSKCFLKPPDNNEFVGWRSDEVPESGGDVDVRPRFS